MANRLNKPVCATDFGNTGFGDCYFDPAKIKGAIKVPESFVITQGDVATLQDLLKTRIHAAPSMRIFPYHNFTSIADNTEDVQIETTEYGAKYVTRDGDYDLTFRYQEGGVLLHGEIQKNSGNGYYLLYDETGLLLGYRTTEGLKGIPMKLIALPWRFATGSTAAQYLLRFIFAPQYINRGNVGLLKVSDFNLFDIKGLQDVEIDVLDLVANVATVQLRTKISDVNMAEAYSTNLARPAALVAYDQDGATIAITTVTVNSTNPAELAFDVTFSTVPFNAADEVYLKGAPAATWRASPILVEGFEAKDAVLVEATGS